MISKGLVYLRPLNTVALRVTGPYSQAAATAWDLMSECLRQRGTSGDVGPGYGLLLDDPRVTIPAQCRYEACIALESLGPVHCRPNLLVKRIPGGAYVRERFVGGDVDIAQTISQLRSELMSKTGLILDSGRPFMEIYLETPFLTPADQQQRDVCLPVMAELLVPAE
jgi:AraC family transcriptional regulator